MNDKCQVCENLEEGDTIYRCVSFDGGIGYECIYDIKYCPVCGEKLLTGEEKWNRIVKSGKNEN